MNRGGHLKGPLVNESKNSQSTRRSVVGRAQESLKIMNMRSSGVQCSEVGCKLRSSEWLGQSWVLQGGCGERQRDKRATSDQGEHLEVKDNVQGKMMEKEGADIEQEVVCFWPQDLPQVGLGEKLRGAVFVMRAQDTSEMLQSFCREENEGWERGSALSFASQGHVCQYLSKNLMAALGNSHEGASQTNG